MVVQKMQTPEGIQKGVRTILTERNLWDTLPVKKVLQCKDCRDGRPTANIYCCARRLLSEQKDFKEQKEWIQEIIDQHDHKVIFFPKFHCELNFIELIWGYLKAKLRKECRFSFEALNERIQPILFEEIPLHFVKRCARHCFRYMNGYRLSLTGPLLDYAVKKYKSHRMIPPESVEEIKKAFAKEQEKKKTNELSKR